MTSKIATFLKLANVDEKGYCKFICTDRFTNENGLAFGNGGGWCRLDGSFGKKYKVVLVKQNGELNTSWAVSSDEMKTIITDIEKECTIEKKGRKIKYIRLYSFNLVAEFICRKIRKDIRSHYLKQKCVVCGTNSKIEVDHKNGLYNDKRVLKLSTQTLDDFQALCSHCNCKKRETIKKMKISKIRYSALEIPSLRIFGTPYTEGDETYDITDPDTMRGTYWYDPIDFISKIKSRLEKISI